MLDLNYILNHPEDLKKSLQKRFIDSESILSSIDQILHKKKEVQSKVESLRGERNRVSKEINLHHL